MDSKASEQRKSVKLYTSVQESLQLLIIQDSLYISITFCKTYRWMDSCIMKTTAVYELCDDSGRSRLKILYPCVNLFSLIKVPQHRNPLYSCFVRPQRKIISRSLCWSFLNYMWSWYSKKSFGMCSKYIIFWQYGKQMHV